MKLNKIICIFCAVLILVITCVNISISAFASDDEDITFVESTKEEVLDFLYEYMIISAKSNVISFEVFCNMINDEWGWTWDDNGYTLIDVQTGVVYGITLDEVGMRGLARSGRGGGGGRRRVTSGEDIEISGETFADIVARLNEQYAPSTPYYISAETDKRWTTNNTGGVMSFYADGVFCNQSNWTEVYCLPFYRDGDEIFFSLYQSHFKQRLETAEDGTNSIYMDVDWLFNADHSVASSTTIYSEDMGNPLIDFASIRYMDYTFVFNVSHNRMYTYSSYANYVQKKGEMYAAALDYDNANSPYLLYKAEDIENSDFSSSINMLSVSSNLSDTIEKGLYVSNEPITLGLNWTGIDSNKIDPNAVVKMGGDTIYDYSITNTAGDTTTINEYVTNNYTYITNNGSDDSGNSSGGSASGDVNVKGEIAVGGQVDVNVNINENSNTSMPVEVDVDNYIEVLPEQAKPVTNLLALFFDFLPVELMSLLLAGVAVAIILRIWGR